MARRIPTINGVHTNGDAPPPSTLAAQIVQNQTRPPVSQQNGQAATFAGLLNEILHNDTAAPETDIDVNVKLVNVVAEVGLAPLVDGNPFAQWDELILQATDSIAVIESTIKRQPEVLFTAINQDGQQLFLPLLTRLASVCGRDRCDTLPIVNLLDCALSTLEASIEFWQDVLVVRQVLEDCASGM